MLLSRPLTAELQVRHWQIWWICVWCCHIARMHCWFLRSYAWQSCSSGRSHKVIFEASISEINHNSFSIMSEFRCGDFYLNLWSSGQPYMRSVVYIVKWWPTPTYWAYLLLVFTLIMTLQSTVHNRTIILLTFLHVFHKRFYFRWPVISKLQWGCLRYTAETCSCYHNHYKKSCALMGCISFIM